MPFRHGHGPFNLTFCYDWYRNELKPPAPKKDDANTPRVLDVRLVNAVTAALTKGIADYTKALVAMTGVEIHRDINYQTTSAHLIHGRGPQGSYIMLLEFPEPTLKFFMKSALMQEGEAVDHGTISKDIAAILVTVQSELNTAAANSGYGFKNIFQGDFSTDASVKYLLKNIGCYVRFSFSVGRSVFTVCFGIDSTFAVPYFDLWDYVSVKQAS